jgi:Tol biopolymer transport system component/DNA-binding winged helix-turn-helix (wHTH) protein
MKGARQLRGFRCGGFEIDLEACELRKFGVRLKLTRQAFQVLAILIARPGQVVSRQELRKILWPMEPHGDHDSSLHKVVSQLRSALGDSAETPRYLETLPRIGYRFLAPVEPIHEPDVAATPDELGPHRPASDSPRRPAWNSAWLWAAAAALLLAVAATFGVWRLLPERWARGRTLVPKPLTMFIGSELYPAFSPDGKQVAFSWDGDNRDNFDIYVIAVTGGQARRLTHGPEEEICPAWSPDGRQIAFLRTLTPTTAAVLVMQADGAGERELAEIHPGPPRTGWSMRALTWTRDPDWLIASDRPGTTGPYVLTLISARTGERRPITAPPPNSVGDTNPAVSPDGRSLAFTRFTGSTSTELFLAGLSLDPDSIAPPRRLTSLGMHIEAPAWTATERELIFTVGPLSAGTSYLCRAKVPEGQVRELTATRLEGIHPAISPDGARMVYVRRDMDETSIWRFPVPDPKTAEKPAPQRIITSSGETLNGGDISPDGRRIVFRSSRSGSPEVWIADSDGADPRQLTHAGARGAGTPRWSPDGRFIAYESRQEVNSAIWITDPDSGSSRKLTFDRFEDHLPTWSRDGQWVYFGSVQHGYSRIWKVPLGGGAPVQVTHGGGVCAAESPDGKSLYFTTDAYPAALRRMPLPTGGETTIADGLTGACSFVATTEGLYYLTAPLPGHPNTLHFVDFGLKFDRMIVSLNGEVHRLLSSSQNGRQLFYSQTDRHEADLMLIDGLY